MNNEPLTQKAIHEKKNILLTFITENQTQKEEAEHLAGCIINELGKGWVITHIDHYYKFRNACKIELKNTYTGLSQAALNLLGIELADRLASPWLLYYDSDGASIELIFNRNENTQYRKTAFQVIRWGQLQITT